MARDLRVRATIEAQDKASPVVSKVQGRFGKFANFLSSRFVITLGDVTRAVRSVLDTIGEFVSAAGRQQSAVDKLNVGLSRLGPVAAEVSARLQDQASALQRVSRFGDEAIIENQAFLASLNLSEAQIRAVSEASVELASTGKVSLDAAFRNIAKTFSGLSGELGELIPQLRDLTAEELKAGEGVRAIQELFSGSAAASVDNFEGKLAQLTNQFGDLQEALGEFITESRDGEAAVSAISTAIDFWTSSIRSNVEAQRLSPEAEVAAAREELARVTDLLRQAEEGSTFTRLSGIDALARAITGASDLERQQAALIDAERRLAAAERRLKESIDGTTDAQRRAREELERQAAATKELESTLNALGIQTESQVSAKVDELNASLEIARQGFEDGALSAEKFAEAEKKIAAEIEKVTGKTQELAETQSAAVSVIAETGNAALSSSSALEVLGRSFDRSEDRIDQSTRALARFQEQASRTVEAAAVAARGIDSAFGGGDFRAIERSQGRGAAVNAALSAGGELSNFGTRVRLPGGGSRLTKPAGSRGF